MRIEDDDEDDSIADELDVDVRLFTFVKLGGELVLLEQLRHAARRGDVARGEGGEAGRVDVVDVAGRRDELTVLVDDEDDLGVRVTNQTVHDRLDLIELLLVHHHLGIDHPNPPRGMLARRRPTTLWVPAKVSSDVTFDVPVLLSDTGGSFRFYPMELAPDKCADQKGVASSPPCPSSARSAPPPLAAVQAFSSFSSAPGSGAVWRSG